MSDPYRESSPGIAREMAIFRGKLAGRMPEQPIVVEELEEQARGILSREAFDYLAGGAGSEDTMRANLAAFKRYRLVPRLLRDVDRRDLCVTLLGRTLPMPVLLAPIGVQGVFHRDGELATARAAAALGIPLVASTVSSRPLEEIAAAMGAAPRWYQLYWPRSDELAESLLERAEKAGYEAIVVTLDTYLLAWRERDLQNAYLPFLHGDGLGNYLSDPVFRAGAGVDPRQDPNRALEYFARVFSDPSRTWTDLARLRECTSLPIVLKGILHPDDARKAVDHGVDGLIVSNHGGRQLDGALAALDALPRVVEAVGDRTMILFDSGIRRGADVIKAMALGARAVLLGRPYAYGLAVGGERGVGEVLLNLQADLDLTLGLVGCASLGELGREHLQVAEPLAALA
jgi:isopentenyl diphosphate isomerase/L-lactate dehydrogenase-like FMN-dependent dehydrogenase